MMKIRVLPFTLLLLGSVMCAKSEVIDQTKGADADKQEYVVDAQPYYDINLLAQSLKTSKYSPFENPTGLYFKAGETVEVVVQQTGGRKIELKIVDFSRPVDGGKKEETSVYPLKNGKNSFVAQNNGLAYISYYLKDYKNAPNVKCTFLTGVQNGVFDPTIHDNKDWNRMLNGAVCEVIDIKGKYVSLVFDVKTLKEQAPKTGVELINTYDDIILCQQEMMGVDQFGYRTNNRMFGRISWSGPPNANGKGVSFPNTKKIVTPESIKKNNWVIGHEFGHVNQLRPGLKWHGTTEVTNNIYALWVQYRYNPNGPLRLEHSAAPDGTGRKTIGGSFNWHFNHCVMEGKPLFYNPQTPFKAPWSDNKNPFVRLCPFWQLQLYNVVAQMGRPDFYAQISEKIRKRPAQKDATAGELQLAFIKDCCDVMQQNMTPFFEKCGMLRPVNGSIGDYGGDRPMEITTKMIDQLKSHAAQYKAPESPVSYYITMNSAEAFKNRASVSGKSGQGVKLEDGQCTVSHNEWKNVVVFEAYAGDKLKSITMVGTGAADNSSTTIAIPEGCERIVAVAWDGKRTEVIKL